MSTHELSTLHDIENARKNESRWRQDSLSILRSARMPARFVACTVASSRVVHLPFTCCLLCWILHKRVQLLGCVNLNNSGCVLYCVQSCRKYAQGSDECLTQLRRELHVLNDSHSNVRRAIDDLRTRFLPGFQDMVEHVKTSVGMCLGDCFGFTLRFLLDIAMAFTGSFFRFDMRDSVGSRYADIVFVCFNL